MKRSLIAIQSSIEGVAMRATPQLGKLVAGKRQAILADRVLELLKEGPRLLNEELLVLLGDLIHLEQRFELVLGGRNRQRLFPPLEVHRHLHGLCERTPLLG